MLKLENVEFVDVKQAFILKLKIKWKFVAVKMCIFVDLVWEYIFFFNYFF